MTKTEQIITRATKLIGEHAEGLRYSVLFETLKREFSTTPPNTIVGSLHKFRTDLPESIYQPARGIYRNICFKEDADNTKQRQTKITIKEEQFYEPFAEWLINELEECTKAISVGGNCFKDKWGTPDVIGIREAKRSDIIKPLTEIVAVEIKVDSSSLITAFGQACSYKLFAHKSYIVVPETSSEDDIARLDSLARIFGIGLILMNPSDPKSPNFTIRVRATRHEPDIFYVNKNLKVVEDKLFD